MSWQARGTFVRDRTDSQTSADGEQATYEAIMRRLDTISVMTFSSLQIRWLGWRHSSEPLKPLQRGDTAIEPVQPNLQHFQPLKDGGRRRCARLGLRRRATDCAFRLLGS